VHSVGIVKIGAHLHIVNVKWLYNESVSYLLGCGDVNHWRDSRLGLEVQLHSWL